MKRQPTPGSRTASRRGYTLVEVMIAAVVLVLVFISCITALQSGFRMVDNARMVNLADQTIQSQIETMKLLGWSYIGGTPTTTTGGTWYFQSEPFTTNLKTASDNNSGWIDFLPYISSVVGNVNSNLLKRITWFKMKVADSVDPDGNTRTGVKLVVVEMRWKGLRGQTFSRQYETFISK